MQYPVFVVYCCCNIFFHALVLFSNVVFSCCLLREDKETEGPEDNVFNLYLPHARLILLIGYILQVTLYFYAA